MKEEEITLEKEYTLRMYAMLTAALTATLLSIVTHTLAESLTRPIAIVGNFLMLRLAHNSGIAFGVMLPPHIQSLAIGVALTLIVVLAIRSKRALFSDIGFGMIIGGAIGNLFDRFPDGYVTDFLALGTFPIFNVADSFISIGVGILLLEGMAEEVRRRKVKIARNI